MVNQNRTDKCLDITFKVSAYTHLENCWPVLIYLFLQFGTFFYITYRDNEWDNLFLLIVLLVFLPPYTMQFIVHFSYWKVNRHDILQYFISERKLVYTHNGVRQEFYLKDVTSITQYQSYPKALGFVTWNLWDDYQYSVIEIGNKEIIITSLLAPDLYFGDIAERYRTKKKLLPMVDLSNVKNY